MTAAILANTIWAPIFVYFYDGPWALCSTAIGFLAEFGVFRLYTRSLLTTAVAFRRLVVANLASYVAGFIAMAFVPLLIHKNNLAETAQAFGSSLLPVGKKETTWRMISPVRG